MTMFGSTMVLPSKIMQIPKTFPQNITESQVYHFSPNLYDSPKKYFNILLIILGTHFTLVICFKII